MRPDMTVEIGGGLINIRVGAIIMKDGKLLMAGNRERPEYLYSVGGRVKFGETAEEAVVREVYEETGVQMRAGRLGFVHENYFTNDMPEKFGKLVYEISFYFYMEVPEDLELKCERFTEDGHEEYLTWIDPNAEIRYYPAFFRTALKAPGKTIRHFVTDERTGTEKEV